MEGQWTGTIPKILGLGGMSLKYMITSGASSPEDVAALGKSALGVPYNVTLDIIPYKFRMEMPLVSEPATGGFVITETRLQAVEKGIEKLTRRKVLSAKKESLSDTWLGVSILPTSGLGERQTCLSGT
jgi:hypothetical protein